MVMRKIFFGSIVFFSVAFLAACGGGSSGSAGSTGATGAAGAAGAAGATGATGATGSISLPTDVVTLTLNQADMDSTKLEVDVEVKVSGLDNVSPDSRLRYYAYEGSSATVKTAMWDPGTATTVSRPTGYITGGLIDSRMITQDDIVLDSVGGANSALPANSAGAPTVTHMIVCSGNEAGDAATCASVPTADRVSHGVTIAGYRNTMIHDSNSASATAAVAFLDNTTNISIAWDGNSAFHMVADNRSAAAAQTANARSGAAEGADNGTIAYRIDNASKANAYASGVWGIDNASTSETVGNINGLYVVISNAAFMGDHLYIATSDNRSAGAYAGPGNLIVDDDNSDNLTIYKQTSGTGNLAVIHESNINIGKHTIMEIGSDGTDLFIVQDNRTANGLVGHIYLDNGTLVSTAGGVCSEAAETSVTSGSCVRATDNITVGLQGTAAISTTDICTVTTTDKMIIVADNGSATAGVDVLQLNVAGTLVSVDNASSANETNPRLDTILGCNLNLHGSTYILTVLEDGGDNITVLTSTDLDTWTIVYEEATGQASSVKISTAAPNGIGDVWVALDDGTNVDLYHSDNGTSGGLVQVHSIAASSLGGIAHDNGSAGSASIGIAVIKYEDSNAAAQFDVYYE